MLEIPRRNESAHARSRCLLTTSLVACLLPTLTDAAGFFDQFRDQEDGWMDASDWVLNNAIGFLPVPFVITEPAVERDVLDQDLPIRPITSRHLDPVEPLERVEVPWLGVAAAALEQLE